MPITINCDLCNRNIIDTIKVEIKDGEHPHNGSRMYKTIDCCSACIKKIPLYCNEEFDNLWAKLNNKSC